jgi:hypothetical protein
MGLLQASCDVQVAAAMHVNGVAGMFALCSWSWCKLNLLYMPCLLLSMDKSSSIGSALSACQLLCMRWQVLGES